MSEGTLSAFGCAVSFIAVAGFYVYLRECWTENEQDSKPPVSSVELEEAKFEDVA